MSHIHKNPPKVVCLLNLKFPIRQIMPLNSFFFITKRTGLNCVRSNTDPTCIFTIFARTDFRKFNQFPFNLVEDTHGYRLVQIRISFHSGFQKIQFFTGEAYPKLIHLNSCYHIQIQKEPVHIYAQKTHCVLLRF